MTAEGLEAYRARAVSAEQQRKAECEERGRPAEKCRDRERDKREADDALAKAEADKASTDQAALLDGKLAEADAALRAVDVKTASKEADPQSASMAKAFGVDQNTIASISHTVLAVAIEIGSGFGAWLVFGHGGARRKDDELAAAPTTRITIEETDEDARARFFQECVSAVTGKRVGASAMHGAYSGWCLGQGRTALASQAFGKDAPWPKEKVGGNIYYLNCVIGTRVRPRPPLQVVVSNPIRRPSLLHEEAT
jgi:hypothetical protein